MLIQYMIVGHYTSLKVVPKIKIPYQSSLVIISKTETIEFKIFENECNYAVEL